MISVTASRLRKNVGELLGRIASLVYMYMYVCTECCLYHMTVSVQVASSAEVWELYADYHFSSTDLVDQEKVWYR